MAIKRKCPFCGYDGYPHVDRSRRRVEFECVECGTPFHDEEEHKPVQIVQHEPATHTANQ